MHFDSPLKLSSAEKIVTNPSQVARHSFYPFIDFIAKSVKVKWDASTKKLEKIPKSRPIAYASHMDSHIYSYYAHKLTRKYEKAVIDGGLETSVIAFRALGKSNIEFAADAFNEISARPESHVICLDIKGFFDNLDHPKLKMAWASLLGKVTLPSDHFAVFKSITHHSKINRSHLYDLLGISIHNPKNGRVKLCSPADFRGKVRKAGLIVSNPNSYGIPQGSPISALLSNIYMLDFDICINTYVCSHGGRYFRYCDDMLLIVPPGVKDGVFDLVTEGIKELKLEFQEKKTERRDFFTIGGGLTCEKPLQYLGFLFDGQRVLLRSASLARYSDRMKRGIRLAKATMEKRNLSRTERGDDPRPLFKKLLYKRYSHFGRRNFLSYGYKAAEVMESSSIKKQLRGLMKKFQEELSK